MAHHVAPAKGRNRGSRLDWNAHKDTILELRQKMSVDALVKEMSRRGFHAKRRQYFNKFKEWNSSKIVNFTEMRFIIHKERKRKARGKETEFTVRGKRLSTAQIRRFEQRKHFPEVAYDASSPDASTPEGISYCSPVSVQTDLQYPADKQASASDHSQHYDHQPSLHASHNSRQPSPSHERESVAPTHLPDETSRQFAENKQLISYPSNGARGSANLAPAYQIKAEYCGIGSWITRFDSRFHFEQCNTAGPHRAVVGTLRIPWLHSSKTSWTMLLQKDLDKFRQHRDSAVVAATLVSLNETLRKTNQALQMEMACLEGSALTGGVLGTSRVRSLVAQLEKTLCRMHDYVLGVWCLKSNHLAEKQAVVKPTLCDDSLFSIFEPINACVLFLKAWHEQKLGLSDLIGKLSALVDSNIQAIFRWTLWWPVEHEWPCSMPSRLWDKWPLK